MPSFYFSSCLLHLLFIPWQQSTQAIGSQQCSSALLNQPPLLTFRGILHKDVVLIFVTLSSVSIQPKTYVLEIPVFTITASLIELSPPKIPFFSSQIIISIKVLRVRERDWNRHWKAPQKVEKPHVASWPWTTILSSEEKTQCADPWVFQI